MRQTECGRRLEVPPAARGSARPGLVPRRLAQEVDGRQPGRADVEAQHAPDPLGTRHLDLDAGLAREAARAQDAMQVDPLGLRMSMLRTREYVVPNCQLLSTRERRRPKRSALRSQF